LISCHIEHLLSLQAIVEHEELHLVVQRSVVGRVAVVGEAHLGTLLAGALQVQANCLSLVQLDP
jgi:hypothetical protein